MKNSNYLGICGAKVRLKLISREDLKKLFQWKNDFNLMGQVGSPPLPNSLKQIQEWFDRTQADKNQVLFGIYSEKTKEFVGIVRLMFIDWINSHAEMGVFIGERTSLGKGLGKEAVRLILKYTFEDLNLNKLYLKVAGSNLQAIKVYESCGLKVEGEMREHFWKKGKFESAIMMSSLKSEL